ncbi:MAG: sensor histidine kinase [Chloroflexi bacterium]|nr:sensor histidine kinase [Chloroflexota bacterium]
MKHEPDILSIFRLFAILWLGLSLLAGGLLLVTEAFSQEATIFFLASVGNALLLLGYLSWPQLARYLGNAYLRIGIVIASAGPIIINHLVSFFRIYPPGTETAFDTWSLTAVLFVPLVIVAWQHPLRDVIVFCLGTALLDMLLIIPVAWGNEFYFFSQAHSILGRTLSFSLVGYMVARIMKIQRQQRQSLSNANTKLVHYAATLERLTITRERNRLARELHDTLAHTLSAVAVELEAVNALWDVDPTHAHTMLGQSLTVTRTGLAETRRAIQSLRSSPLEDLGLALAIRQEAESVTSRANLALDLRTTERLDNLSPDVEQCFYRIAQEALANIVHHAQAQNVKINLFRDNDHLILSVSDDGCGFDPITVDTEHHLGIRGMRERAEMLGTNLEIDSEPGQGTAIRLVAKE